MTVSPKSSPHHLICSGREASPLLHVVRLSPIPIPVELDPADKHKATATFKVSGKGKSDENGEWQDIGREMGRYFNDDGNAALKASFKKTDEGWQMYTIELLQTGKR